MTVIIIITITIALMALFWLFISGTYTSLTSSGESTVSGTLVTISSCMKIESVSGNKVYVKNCGEGSVTNDTLKIYLNDVPLNFTMSPTIVSEDEVGTVSLYGLWGLPEGGHLLKVTNPKVITEMAVESFLHESCVLALDFDEGEGTITYDKSRYKNNGILGNDSIWTRPSWIAGRFGKALEFDGLDNYVNISNDESLNLTDLLTVSAWIYPRGWGENQYGKIIHKLTGCCGSDGYSIYMSDLWDTLVLKLGTAYYDDRFNLFINFNKWQHVLATFNGTHVSFYKNNIGFNPISRATPIPTNDKPVYIGNSEGLDRTFDGIIDSVRIFNESLTPDETIVLKPVKYY